MTVVPYDPDWPRRFEQERDRLTAALAPWLDGGIHHVGSTAVPGLAAKPVIDMRATCARPRPRSARSHSSATPTAPTVPRRTRSSAPEAAGGTRRTICT